MRTRICVPSVVSCLTYCCNFVFFCHAFDTLREGQTLQNGETLVSANGIFELGFFGTGDPGGNHYLGTWLKKDVHKKAFWVANRDNPVYGETGNLTIRYDGNLVISDVRIYPNIVVNSEMLATGGNTRATLVDSGNFVLYEGEKVLWQSFDYPSDTFLPGMKLGWLGIDTNQTRKSFLLSWLTPSVPASGPFALGLDSHNKSIFKVWRRSSMSQEIGFWDGHSFRFFFQRVSDSYSFTFVSNKKEIYLTFNTNEGKSMSWFVLTSSGEINEFTMLDGGVEIVNYTLCNNREAPETKGCLVPLPNMCGGNNNFSEIKGSIPVSMVVSGSTGVGPSDCEMMCLINCSCSAFASFQDDGTGCQLYYGDKQDLLKSIGGGNSILYVRGDVPKSSGIQRKWKLAIIISTLVVLVPLVLSSVWCYLGYKKVNHIGITREGDDIRDSASLLLFQFGTNVAAVDTENSADAVEQGKWNGCELPLVSFSCIVDATGNFSAENKIGEGGFGPVYKGKLLGHEIAVKRLSRLSGQGLEEFRNEVRVISMLQHSNLVRLLGYCTEQAEKIVLYEYLQNRSLDSILFDETKSVMLDWRKRLHIIEGIAQGLLYLHKYSRLRIIHRDLKTSNILLDTYFNPKISDFGMARIVDESIPTKTKRIAGTYGYMSPEYAVHGLFSTKSDIFSFGVIVLEIISGKRNTTFYEANGSLNLLGFAWETWKEERWVEFMDPTLADSFNLDELKLCLNVALLCIQEKPKDRPTTSDVVSMVNNERGGRLPVPKRPAFSTLTESYVESNLEGQKPSCNDITFSAIEGR
ncbi:PREDICTED: receptor-like serine/threonine-protein kinase SD1-6 isoform X1 [Ipomoea nil]|uniref:receptor-like serine/threonine-protein kinase SD1-6 isoform X1 n=3 Tax=Ipomoea nil TaxID=35883 RepID=UPI000901A489|nr:PREDICTED: receptor-like serine/threonine-protein kinase SD1-6 isoform X1 [Ipomoea nil]